MKQRESERSQALERKERRMFAARAAWQTSQALRGAPLASAGMTPPAFTSVLALVRRELPENRRTPSRALRSSLGFLAFAAVVAIGVGFTREKAPTTIEAEPPPSFACWDAPASLAVEATAYETDRAVASAEDRYAACLFATPRAAPAGALCAAPVANDGTDVTCKAARPQEDEIFESRIRGGSLQ
jgi:hypothetical protein